MVYYFHWEDILQPGLTRKVKRVEARGGEDIEFSLADLAPTENVRVLILNDSEDHLGVILFKR